MRQALLLVDSLESETNSKTSALVLGRILREAREDAELTQEALAIELGFRFNNIIARIEHGSRKVGFLEFIAMAKALKRDPTELMQEYMRRMKS